MQISQLSSQNFNGINVFGERNFNRQSRKLIGALDNLTSEYVNPILSKLEAERGANINVLVQPQGIVNLSLAKKYLEFPLKGSMEHIETDLVLVNSKGKDKIEKTIDANKPAKVWMQELRNFIRSCQRYLDKPDAKANLPEVYNQDKIFVQMDF